MTRILTLLLGDRYGVGPELAAAIAAVPQPEDGTVLVLVGDRAVFERGAAAAGVSAALPQLAALSEVPRTGARVAFLHRPFDAPVAPVAQVSERAGRESIDSFLWALDEAAAGHADGIVYGPFNKQAMRLAGHAAGDELDLALRHLGWTGPAGEVNVLGALWTSRVTSHIPLARVAGLLSIERVGDAIDLLAAQLQRAGVARPRLAVAGLNPHAGEGGTFGREEIDIIEPAIAAARAAGHDVEGPFPADTVFVQAAGRAHQAIVTMYHDQGQIALKLMGLGRGVTLLAGLPVPVTTPAHGTAFDLAGTGRARTDGLAAAIALNRRMIAPVHEPA